MSRSDCPVSRSLSMAERARWVQMLQTLGISDTPRIWLYQSAKTTTHRSCSIRVWIMIPETGHHMSRLRSLSLAGVPVKGKLVDRQDEASSEPVITCGHELLGLEALGSQALERVDLGQPLSPC